MCGLCASGAPRVTMLGAEADIAAIPTRHPAAGVAPLGTAAHRRRNALAWLTGTAAEEGGEYQAAAASETSIMSDLDLWQNSAFHASLG